MTTPAIQTFGTTFSFGGQLVAHVLDIAGPGETAESEDITNHDSPQAYREKIAVMLDGGECTFDMIYIHADGQRALRAKFLARSTEEAIIEWPDGSTATFDGFVSNWNWATPVAGSLRTSIGVTVTGPVDVEFSGS